MCLSMSQPKAPKPPKPPALPPPPPTPAPPPKPAPAPKQLQNVGSTPDVRAGQKKKSSPGTPRSSVSTSSLRSTLNIGGSNTGGLNS